MYAEKRYSASILECSHDCSPRNLCGMADCCCIDRTLKTKKNNVSFCLIHFFFRETNKK